MSETHSKYLMCCCIECLGGRPATFARSTKASARLVSARFSGYDRKCDYTQYSAPDLELQFRWTPTHSAAICNASTPRLVSQLFPWREQQVGDLAVAIGQAGRRSSITVLHTGSRSRIPPSPYRVAAPPRNSCRPDGYRRWACPNGQLTVLDRRESIQGPYSPDACCEAASRSCTCGLRRHGPQSRC
jgi:hypothetical protein